MNNRALQNEMDAAMGITAADVKRYDRLRAAEESQMTEADAKQKLAEMRFGEKGDRCFSSKQIEILVGFVAGFLADEWEGVLHLIESTVAGNAHPMELLTDVYALMDLIGSPAQQASDRAAGITAEDRQKYG